jgi:hypothetical protein
MNDWERELKKAFKELDEETVRDAKIRQEWSRQIVDSTSRIDQPTPHWQRPDNNLPLYERYKQQVRDDEHQAHIRAHEEIIRKAMLESVMAFLDEIRGELTNIRKILAKANKPKREKK